MSDGFLTLAQAPGGLTYFLMPRWLPEGRNPIRPMRLKDKLGNRANASAEIELEGAMAFRPGKDGAGIGTIIEIVHHTRLDTALAHAGLMRAARAGAVRWCEGRRAFRRLLIDPQLIRVVLADLALDWKAAIALGLRVAAAFDDPAERGFARIAVALAKFHANKRVLWVVGEALECLGGIGYVEETPLPLLYREAPLNGIWEGSGNVICLDVLRSLKRMPDAAASLRTELESAVGANPVYDEAVRCLPDLEKEPSGEAGARLLTERLAVLLGAPVLLRHGPPAVADAYCSTRLGPRGSAAGTIGPVDAAGILERLEAGGP